VVKLRLHLRDWFWLALVLSLILGWWAHQRENLAIIASLEGQQSEREAFLEEVFQRDIVLKSVLFDLGYDVRFKANDNWLRCTNWTEWTLYKDGEVVEECGFGSGTRSIEMSFYD